MFFPTSWRKNLGLMDVARSMLELGLFICSPITRVTRGILAREPSEATLGLPLMEINAGVIESIQVSELRFLSGDWLSPPVGLDV